jgi:hypothetical protein
MELIDLYFDKGNGASFKVQFQGRLVLCFVSQDNSFLSDKTGRGQSFPDVFNRYSKLVAEAAALSISRNGLASDPRGHLVAAQDLQTAQRGNGHGVA